MGSLNGLAEVYDPAAIVNSAQWHILVNLGVNLVVRDGQGRLVGEAAKTWRVSPDLTEFRFQLRDGLRDSAGHVLDSQDWRETLTHLLRSGGSTHSFISQFLDEGGIATPDSRTLVLKLKKPYQTFIHRLTTPEFILVPRCSLRPGRPVDLGVSSGPYYLSDCRGADRPCRLAANKLHSQYSDKQAEEVVLHPFAKSTLDVFEKISAGEWQFSIAQMVPTDPARKRLDGMVSEGSVLAEKVVAGAVGFVLLRDSARIKGVGQRLAVAKLLGEAAEGDMNGLGAVAAHQVYPAGFVGALPPSVERRLFADIQRRAKGERLPARLLGIGSPGVRMAGGAQWVQRTLENAGVKVEMSEMPYTEYQRRQEVLDHDFVVVMTGMNSADPAGSLLTLLSPKSGIIPDPEGTLNSLLQHAVEVGPDKRPPILHAVSEALVKDARVVPFMHYGSSIVSSPDIIARPPSKYEDELRLNAIRWRE